MASTGQASMHRVQPMQYRSSMTAPCSGPGAPHDGSSCFTGRPVRCDSARMVASPPGTQRLMSAWPAAIASAYGSQPG